MEKKTLMLAQPLRRAMALAAVTNLVIGLLFLFGPELGFALWPRHGRAKACGLLGQSSLAMVWARHDFSQANLGECTRSNRGRIRLWHSCVH